MKQNSVLNSTIKRSLDRAITAAFKKDISLSNVIPEALRISQLRLHFFFSTEQREEAKKYLQINYDLIPKRR